MLQLNDSLRDKLGQILEHKNIRDEFVLTFARDMKALDFSAEKKTFPKLCLEIGSGWGEFTLACAAAETDTLFIALEKKRKRIFRSLRYQRSAGLTNIRWMVIDVDWFFAELFAPGIFDRIVINFPDPWPKKRHHKHRFMTPDFAARLKELAKPGAELQFATDFYPYMDETLSMLENSSDWRNINGRGVILPEIPGRPKSFFEELKKSEGEHTYFAVYQRL